MRGSVAPSVLIHLADSHHDPVAQPKTINDLPNEILAEIFNHVDPHRGERVLGHIPDDPPPSPPDAYLIKDFITNSSSYCSLALVNKRFSHLAQEALFYAPILGCFLSWLQSPSRSRIVYFIRTLFARPDLRRHVHQLRLSIPLSVPSVESVEEQGWFALSHLDSVPIVADEVNDMVCDVIKTLDVPQSLRTSWCVAVQLNLEPQLIGVLMALLPRLETISIANPEPSDHYRALSPVHVASQLDDLQMESRTDYLLRVFSYLPVSQTLKYMKISNMIPSWIDGFNLAPHIHTLDYGAKLCDIPSTNIRLLTKLYENTEKSSPLFTLTQVRRLRIDCQIKTVGIWNHTAHDHISSILRMFHHITHLDFYAEPSLEKNPFRSVRAFPHYQANIQHYPDEVAESDITATANLSWDERVYDARTQYTDYQHLVDSLHHMKPHLENLSLPGGFWTLPGAARKALPRFEKFERLTRLTVPQAAILSLKLDNMLPLDVIGDFELSPGDALPPRLERLRVFDADAKLLESSWLEELFDGHRDGGRWVRLRRLEVLFGPACRDEEFEQIVAGVEQDKFWKMVDRAGFEVELGRDVDVPALGLYEGT